MTAKGLNATENAKISSKEISPGKQDSRYNALPRKVLDEKARNQQDESRSHEKCRYPNPLRFFDNRRGRSGF